MNKCLLSASVIAMLFCKSILACINERDLHSAAIVLNSNETVSFDKIDSIGKEGVNFFKICTEASLPESAQQITVLTTGTLPELSFDNIVVNSVSIYGNMLAINVSYSGGCNSHEITLFANQSMEKSIPPVLSLMLSHDARGDLCEAYITETLYFNLVNLQSLISGYSSAILSIQIPHGIGKTSIVSMLWQTENNCSIQYRSHYDPSMLVSIEYVAHSVTGALFPTVRIISDPSIQTLVPVNYGIALTNELEWLAKNQIISSIEFNDLENAGSKITSSNGGWYWTYQDSAVDFNSMFSYTTDSSGTKQWDSLVYVYSTSNTYCSDSFDFILPSDSLVAKTSTVITHTALKSIQPFTTRMISGNCFLTLSEKSESDASIVLFDLKGRIISRYVIPPNKVSAILPIGKGLAKGTYRVVYRSGSISASSSLVIDR